MGAPLAFECKTITVAGPPPQFELPHLGTLQKALDAMGDIPDPGDLILKFQDALAVAMAPVRRFLEMVECFLAVKNCITAIPDAVKKMSPKPIYDCIKELTKVFVRLMMWIPPYAYIPMGRDICAYTIDLIAALITFFERLDNRIAALVAAYEVGIALDDIELVAIVNCGMSEVIPQTLTALDALRFIKPFADLLFDVFLRLIPSEGMQKAVEDYTAAGVIFDDTAGTLRAGGSLPGAPIHALVPLPPLAPLFTAMGLCHNSMVFLHNLLVDLIGSGTPRTQIEIPVFQYL